MLKQKDSIDPLDILARLRWSESDDLEFKSARGGLPQSLWQTYSAMANTKGGVILLGVENDGTITGLTDLNKIKKGFWDTVNNRNKVSLNLLTPDDVEEFSYPNGKVLAIRVPRASRYQRPVFLEQNPFRGSFRRNHEGDYHCTDQEVSRMLVDKSEEQADSRILNHFLIEDLDAQSLRQYRQRFASLKPTHPWLGEDDKGLLTKLGGWRECRETGLKGITVAGLLMFGKEEALREALPQYHIDYREKLSDDPAIRWTDRITIDGTWAGNLFQFYVKVVQKLSADIKLPFQLDAEMFRKGETIVHEAIREALVNSLIHADYLGQGGIVIEKYKDRFEFSNPGLLLISVDQLLLGNMSECRNKSLQTMFTMIGAAEKAGSGIDKIKRGWRSQQWRSPTVKERVQPDRVLWTLPMISLIPKESLTKLMEQFGSKFQEFSPPEIQALVTADLDTWIDNARMRQITSEHATDTTKLLQTLVRKGGLVQDGQGRWARYCLPLTSDSLHKEGNSVHKPTNSVHKEGNSVHKPTNSVHKEGNSVHKEGNSVHKPTKSVHKTELIGNEWDELTKIAETARKNRRLPYKQLENILLKLCQKRWLTKRHLAELLNRNSDGLRSRFLGTMVEQGLLSLQYPDRPNHIDQAYTANQVATAE